MKLRRPETLREESVISSQGRTSVQTRFKKKPIRQCQLRVTARLALESVREKISSAVLVMDVMQRVRYVSDRFDDA